MRVLIFVLLFATLGVAAETYPGSGTRASADTNSDEPVSAVHDQVYDLEHKFGQALVHKDKEFLASRLADNLIEIAWDGMVFTKDKILSDLAYLHVGRYQIRNIKFRSLGSEAALLTYDLTTQASTAGKRAPARQYASSIWVKQNGVWRLLMHQSTPARHQ